MGYLARRKLSPAVRPQVHPERRRRDLSRIAKRSSGRRLRDRRSAGEILGYGPDGLPS